MKNINYKHLTIVQRDLIEHLLNKNKNFSEIGVTLKLDRTTISKEVRRNFTIKVNTYSKVICENQINCGISSCNYQKYCYKAKECKLLTKPPYVCNSCSKKIGCKFTKRYYFGSEAQKLYDERKVESKKGYDISEEDINIIEKIIVPLVKDKNQPINHIYNNHSDILYFSKPTFYRYINNGVISLSNIDLPKKFLTNHEITLKKRKRNIKLMLKVEHLMIFLNIPLDFLINLLLK